MKQGDANQRRVETARIVGIYAIFGLAWIYGSDHVLDWMFEDRALLLRIAVAKGFLFILCTAALLYFLISRYLDRLGAAERERLEILDNYRTIFNATNEAIFLHDIDSGRILDVNQQVLEMYGYTREEALAGDIGLFSAGSAPYSQSEAVAKVRKAADEGPQVFQWLAKRKNGEQFWAEVSLRRTTARGKLAIIAVVRDVTERKRQEDALKEKNAHLRFFFEYAPASLAMFDRKMRYMQVSRRWQSMYGLGDRNLIGLSHYDVFPEITERWKELHRRGLAGEVLGEEADRFVRADGTVQWVRWEIRPWYEAVDRVGGIVIFTEDITQRKLTEEALSANERFLRMLTDQLPGMVAYWDNDLRCSFANKAYQEWFGKSPEQMIGITLPELLGEKLFAENEQYVRKALAGEPQHFERTLVKPGGEKGYTWAHYIPDKIGGVTRGFYVLVSDVTELKLAEAEKVRLESQLQQAQKLESVGRLAGGVAHDFNNLLTVILGLAQLGMGELDPGDPVRGRLEGIRQAAEKSAALTQQLLGFARKQTIAPVMLDLNQTVEQMLSMLKRLVGENIEVVWRPARELWRVKMDPTQLDQILANLCVNARDAIDDVGRIIIETGNARLDQEYCAARFGFVPGEYVQLTVSDDGCGMDKEMMAHIFEPFFTTKKLGKGTGLGLATLYGIVKQNNGFINTYSEPCAGTTFKIYLPRHDAAKAETLPEPAEQPVSRGHETILLVEDEPSIREVTISLLQLQGYRVLAAGLPREALELARAHADEIDLVMTDVVMPEMNGRELARSLLAISPRLKVLFMSGYTANVIAHHGVLEEGVNFISKPFSLPDLAEKVREVLDAKTP
ncbi:sensor histidine kinase response regulator, PAS, PAS and PAS domain-containing [Citrifermentans bemidjiense Bem]|uniref:histidine kinase n=1 Tax=Citrifermentans bemidjiense (strain ATCC BAA-1014 / DSM 16622 / JCM 12645 / Bem) TaxID=404380 RepID=B5ECZ2_CITBB|nr:PAS domain S-box protein [Citrifermentans bemidjiense]ACH40609.1 sensor histidine kinase response regulator, PAS, PAS and PAS domain-containing [Citrifermentans bemidjiense Bem]